MLGVQLTGPGSAIVDKCLERGLRINCTNNTVLRFMPAMIDANQGRFQCKSGALFAE
jgi:acetylornithine/succinyldiaminopimelate/putrescine aminotransferase